MDQHFIKPGLTISFDHSTAPLAVLETVTKQNDQRESTIQRRFNNAVARIIAERMKQDPEVLYAVQFALDRA